MSIFPETSLDYETLWFGSSVLCGLSACAAIQSEDNQSRVGFAVMSAILGLASVAAYQAGEYPLLPDGGIDLFSDAFAYNLHRLRNTKEFLALNNFPISKGTWEQIVKLQPTKLAIANCTGIVDEDLKILARLPHLNTLRLEKLPDIKGDGWHHLKNLSHLKHLHLKEIAFSDTAINHLLDCPLESLCLTDINIQGPGLQNLNQLVDLRYLALSHLHSLDPQDMQPWPLPAKLKTFSLTNVPVKDIHLTALENHPSLEELTLISCNELTDHIATYFPTMPRLEYIDIDGSKGFKTNKAKKLIEQWNGKPTINSIDA